MPAVRLSARRLPTLRALSSGRASSPFELGERRPDLVPLDGCNAFEADRERLQVSGLRWPDARRTALLRLLQTQDV